MKYLLLLSWRTVRANRPRSLVNISVIALSVAMVVVTSGLCAVMTEVQRQAVLSELSAGISADEIARVLQNDWGMGMMHLISLFFNGLMLAVAAFMIYGTFAAGIRERAKLMAVLMTVGATDLQKSFVTVAETMLLALIGIPLGILIGFPVVYATSARLESIFEGTNYHVTGIFRLDVETLFKVAAIAVSVVFLSALISVIKTQKRSVIGLVRTTAGVEVSLKKSPLDWIMWRLFGKAGELASANYVNQKRNYRYLSFAFAVSMSLYVGGSVLIPYFMQMGKPDPHYINEATVLSSTVHVAIQAVPLLAMLNAVCMFISNFRARKEEFAIFQSIGMDVGMMYKIVILEWVYRGFYLFLYGLFGAYALNLAVYSVLVMAGVAEALINPFWQLLHAFLAVVLLCAVMTVIMITQLRRMNIAQTLKAHD